MMTKMTTSLSYSVFCD